MKSKSNPRTARSRRSLHGAVGRRLAQRIARKLFTPGGERRIVDHLRLMRGERYICGWAYGPAVDAIQQVIESSNEKGQP